MKKYNLDFSQDMEAQIKSYLALLHLSVGMIVCKDIYLCSYDYSKNDFKKVKIEFDKDNDDGIFLIELLKKENISDAEIKKFIDEVLKRPQKPKEPPSTKGDSPLEEFPLEPKFMIIKTSDKCVKISKGNLYDATRHAWKVTYDKAIRYPYVLSVIDKRVQEVYKVKCWQKADRWPRDDGPVVGRFEFVGEVATDDIRQKWIDKLIPEKFRKKGLASPCLYSDMGES